MLPGKHRERHRTTLAPPSLPVSVHTPRALGANKVSDGRLIMATWIRGGPLVSLRTLQQGQVQDKSMPPPPHLPLLSLASHRKTASQASSLTAARQLDRPAQLWQSPN